MTLLVATDKGLMVYQLLGPAWELQGIHFLGMPVGAVHVTEAGVWWVGINHKHWGTKLHWSADAGQTWQEAAAPRFPEERNTAVKALWLLESVAERLYVGVEPAALFASGDGGQSFHLLEGLSDHPTRSRWMGGGKGSKDPFVHTLLIDPADARHLTVGISVAGVFQSYDSGATWEPTNEGLVADFLPNPTTQIGQDPHVMRRVASQPEVIWQQNHCGIFRSTDHGRTWQEVTDPLKKANYGFALAVDPANADRAWVIPAESDFLRIPHNQALAVYRTDDAGQHWHPFAEGLPQAGAFDLALRHGLDFLKGHLVFGTNNGNLYHSADAGETWQTISQSLATVRAVKLLEE